MPIVEQPMDTIKEHFKSSFKTIGINISNVDIQAKVDDCDTFKSVKAMRIYYETDDPVMKDVDISITKKS